MATERKIVSLACPVCGNEMIQDGKIRIVCDICGAVRGQALPDYSLFDPAPILKVIGIIFGIWAVIAVVGVVLVCMLDDCTDYDFNGPEGLAVVLFWPILAIVFGIIGCVKLFIYVRNNLIEYLKEIEDEQN